MNNAISDVLAGLTLAVVSLSVLYIAFIQATGGF